MYTLDAHSGKLKILTVKIQNFCGFLKLRDIKKTAEVRDLHFRIGQIRLIQLIDGQKWLLNYE